LEKKIIALVPVAALIILILITVLFGFSDKIYLNPPNLVFVTNLLFWSIASISIAYISAKSFTKEGSVIVLIISCSILVLGLSLIISGWVTNFSGNYSVAIANIGILVASALQVLCGILSLMGNTSNKIGNNIKTLISIYILAVVLVLAISASVLWGYVPAFFTASGPTLLRQTVLGSGILLFAIACTLFVGQYLKSKASSVYWYALAIGLFSISLLSTFEIKALGDLLTWLGRIGLYIGAIYLIAALLSTKNKAKGIDRASAWAGAFKTNPKQIEALFSNILDAFVYGKIIVDKDGKPIDWIFLDVNDSYGKVAGLEKNQIIGKTVSEIYPDEHNDPTDWIGKYGQVAITGEPLHFEGYRQTMKRWIHVSSYSPKKGYFIAIFEDITERKKAEEAVQQSEQRYRGLFGAVAGGVVVQDQNGSIIEANDIACEILGLSRDQMQGRTSADPRWHAICEDNSPFPGEEHPAIITLKTGQAVRNVVMGVFHPSIRQYRWILINSEPIVSTYEKNVVAAVTTFVDITDLKKAQEKLRENEHLYRTVFDNSQDGFQLIELVYDKDEKPIDHKFLKVNQAYEKIIGVKAEDVLDKTAKYISPHQEPHWLEVPDRVSKTGISEHVELYNKDINKTLDCFYFLYSTNVVGTLFRDITDRKYLEKQLRDSERLAAIGATAGMVGHDIRNPLQAITGDVYLAKTELDSIPESDEKKGVLESLQEIEKNTEYINKIVADLQDFARPLKPNAEETDLKLIIEELLKKNGLPENVKVSVKVEPDARNVVADHTFINRIMYNLVNNAVQAMPNGGKLTIHSYKEANDVIISVKDTGVGIPEAVKGKLFTPMFTTKAKGQGFGLAVIKRMTESLGGTVTFESQEGKGTSFIIRLPQNKK
jgi:PAS domain S-box-containing protein